MKLQDIGFFLLFVVIFLLKKPRLFLTAGLISWLIAIPLFARWIFFTAERLTWYGAAFVLTYLLVRHEK